MNKSTYRFQFQILLLIILFIIQCNSSSNSSSNNNLISDNISFYYSGTITNDTSGSIMWEFYLLNNGEIKISKSQWDQKTDYENIKLTESEKNQMWELIDRINFNNMQSYIATGNPDEEFCYFKLVIRQYETEKVVLLSNRDDNDEIILLINMIYSFINKYSYNAGNNY